MQLFVKKTWKKEFATFFLRTAVERERSFANLSDVHSRCLMVN